MRPTTHLLTAALFSTLLAACGGGSGGAGDPQAPEHRQPVLIGRFEISNAGGSASVANSLKLRLRVERPPEIPEPGAVLMPTLTLGLERIGDTIAVDPTTPEYAAAIALLTNGVDDSFFYGAGPNSGGNRGTNGRHRPRTRQNRARTCKELQREWRE